MSFVTDILKKYWKRYVYTRSIDGNKVESNGSKRLVASLLVVLTSVLQTLGLFVPAVSLPLVAASVGGIGIAHAAAAKRGVFKDYFLATVASLLVIAEFVPGLQPYTSIIQQIAALFGAGAIGQKIGEVKVKDEIVATTKRELYVV